MKACSHCKQLKPLDSFSKNKSRADGHHHQCKQCRSKYYEANKVNIIKDSQQRYINERDKKLAQAKQRYELKREEILAYHAKYREANRVEINTFIKAWNKRNHGKKIAYNNQRKAKQMQRTPAWLTATDLFELDCIYTYAAALNSVGLRYHVDHRIPLQGVEVSGLHIPENLQVITAKENMQKGNRYHD
jgi:hypothetical protein